MSQGRTRASRIAFSAILFIVGAVSVFVSLNVAFGGLRTLGWQGPTDYFSIADQAQFAIRDNHARFFGGMFLALGLFLMLAATNVARYRSALLLAFALIFAGGLARLTQLQFDITFGPAIVVSAAAELVLMPVLFVWLLRRRADSEPVA